MIEKSQLSEYYYEVHDLSCLCIRQNASENCQFFLYTCEKKLRVFLSVTSYNYFVSFAIDLLNFFDRVKYP